METTTLHIKNMVCDRCIAAVRSLLEGMGLKPLRVSLGAAEVEGTLDSAATDRLQAELRRLGFELLQGRNEQVVGQIRSAIVELVHKHDAQTPLRLSAFLADRLHTDYSSLSKLFSEQTGSTIESYFVRQRIERVKELLSYGELTLSQIAVRLNYSSTAYLSAQFKQVTGMTPTAYKKAAERQTLDSL